MSAISEQIGRELAGRYRLEAGLGTGASAHVYAAQDIRLGRRVAVKLLHPGLSGDRSFLRRFATEAQAVAALDHRNIVQVLDWGDDDDDGPFLVLEYLGGGSLADLLDSGARLGPAQAAAVGLGASRGLAYAHRRGLVHRDVKPANLLFDEEGEVHIADFGLARALAEAAWTEPAGAVLGTARYAAPEQAEGRPLDGRSDVYSLALVLYEAVTGRVPFSADTTLATLMARIGATLPPAAELGPLAPVLAQATIPEPLVRLEADELASDLEMLLRALPPPDPLPLAPRRIALEAFTDAADAAALGRPATAAPARPVSPARVVAIEREASHEPFAVDPVLTREPPTRAAEEDHEGTVARADRRAHPRRRRRVLLAVFVVLLALGAAAFAGRRVLMGVHVPVLVGERLAVASSRLRHDGLRLGQTRLAYSALRPAGSVLSQRPLPGSRVSRNSRVELVVSRGHAPVAVPHLAALSRAAALAELSSNHFVAAVEPIYSETVPAGHVVAASPAAGQAPYGSTITLEVSEGPHPRTIPQFSASTTWAGASSMLAGERLVPLEQQAYSNVVPAGEIIATSPAEGAGGVPVGSKVTVVISLGPRLVSVPQVAGEPVAQAIATLRNAGLDVTEQVGPPFATKASTTDPQAGTRVRPGSAITLYVA